MAGAGYQAARRGAALRGQPAADELEMRSLRDGKVGPAWRRVIEEIVVGWYEHLHPSRSYPAPTLRAERQWSVMLRVLLGAAVVSSVAFTRSVVAFLVAFPIVLAVGGVLAFRRMKGAPSRRLLRQIQGDLEDGSVRCEIAAVDVVDDGYTSRVGERRLVMTTSAAERLRDMLGSHRAYLLPRSGLVLAVEPIPSESAYRGDLRSSPPAIDPVAAGVLLAHALRFSPRWAAANSAGKVAPGQWRAVVAAGPRAALEVLVAAILFRAGVALGPGSGLPLHDSAGRLQFALDVGYLLLFVATPVLVVVGHVVVSLLALSTGEVVRIEPVRVVPRDVTSSGFARPRVFGRGADRVRVPPSLGGLLAPNVRYRGYYLSRANVLIGIEGVAGSASEVAPVATPAASEEMVARQR